GWRGPAMGRAHRPLRGDTAAAPRRDHGRRLPPRRPNCGNRRWRRQRSPVGPADAQAPGPPFVHACGLIGVLFTPDGTALSTTADGGSLRRWPLPKPAQDSPQRLALRLQVRTALRMTADRQSVAVLTPGEWRKAHYKLVALEGSSARACESPADLPGFHDA